MLLGSPAQTSHPDQALGEGKPAQGEGDKKSGFLDKVVMRVDKRKFGADKGVLSFDKSVGYMGTFVKSDQTNSCTRIEEGTSEVCFWGSRPT